MQSQQQAVQLANQLSYVQSISRQLHQAEDRRQQIEQQEIAQTAQCRQLVQQLEQAITNCVQTANQIAQVPVQQATAFGAPYGVQQPIQNWQAMGNPNPSVPLS